MGITLSIGYHEVFGKTEAEELNKCVVCLDAITNRCLTNLCRHEFCFECLLQWSEVHNFYPICRQLFEIIIHSFRSETYFDLLIIKNEDTVYRKELLRNKNSIREELENLKTK